MKSIVGQNWISLIALLFATVALMSSLGLLVERRNLLYGEKTSEMELFEANLQRAFDNKDIQKILSYYNFADLDRDPVPGVEEGLRKEQLRWEGVLVEVMPFDRDNGKGFTANADRWNGLPTAWVVLHRLGQIPRSDGTVSQSSTVAGMADGGYRILFSKKGKKNQIEPSDAPK